MCGRYVITVDPARLAEQIGGIDRTGPDPDAEAAVARARWRADYNVAPTTEILIVTAADPSDPLDATDVGGHGADDRRPRVRTARWGLVPPWAREFGDGPVLFNARAETVTEKPSFRADVRRRRCLIPMDGWYEWRPGNDAAGRPVKQPVYMSLAGGARLAMAGVWSVYGDGRRSATMITTDAVGPLRAVHDRMPRIVGPADWDRWLDPATGPPADLLGPVAADVAETVTIRPVSRLVNSVRNNGPDLLAPVESDSDPEESGDAGQDGQLPLL